MNSIHFDCIDSTNNYLKRNYQEIADKTFVSADKQTASRGRSGRKWDSDNKKNLLFSLLLKDKDYFDKYKSISVLSALVIIKTLEEYGIDDLAIKWPNDVYAAGRKICGILLEAVCKEEMECLIIGIGLNVNQEEFSKQYQAISMKEFLKEEINLDELKLKIFNNLINSLELLKNNQNFYDEIIKYDYLKNKKITAVINGENKQVLSLGINNNYELEVLDGNQNIKLDSGEVCLLREVIE